MFFENYDACLISNPAAGKQSHYFTGKELDTSGLYHYGARYYHPLIAHFTQPDPLIQDPYDPQTLNHYAYCRNNPLFYTDPTGMSLFGPSWGGFGNWWGSFWGGMGSMFSFGISTIGRWGMQMGSWVSKSWDDLGQPILNEVKIWSAAYRMGLEYGSSISFPLNSPQFKVLKFVSDNIAEPFNNTILRPGYNLGTYIFGEKNLKNLFGASLDVGWAIVGTTGTIKAVAASGEPYWRYIGSKSSPTYGSDGQVINRTWLTRGYQPPYTNMAIAKDKLQLPYMPTSFEQVNVSFGRFVTGGRGAIKHPDWGVGGGWEYRVGGWYGE